MRGTDSSDPPVQVRILCPQPFHSFKMFHFLTPDVKVSRNGRIAKSWIQRIRMNGKPTHMGLGAVNQSSSALVTKLAFHFLVLTAARSGEVRGATWINRSCGFSIWHIYAGELDKTRARGPCTGSGRILRVAVNTRVAPWRVVSVFFDRSKRDKL